MKRSRGPDRARDRKQRQLCSQVEQAIDHALCESTDPVLQGCWVVDVRPAPTQSRLLVRVQTSDTVRLDELGESLTLATPWLRSEVASSIHRSKTPALVVVWAGPQD